MTVNFDITTIITTTNKSAVVEKYVFGMTATETDDVTGDVIATAVLDAAIENPPAGDVKDIIIAYAKQNGWKQRLLDMIVEKKAASEKTSEVMDLTTIDPTVKESVL
jgi:hypothetical protein